MTVHVLATGGTIASHLEDGEWRQLSGADLLAELDGASGRSTHDVVVEDIAAGPSSNLGVDEMLAIAARVAAALDRGASGVIVTHGTDTMELTAFVVDLVLGAIADRPPVVFTGSMRAHSHSAPDGPRNLLDAFSLIDHPDATGREVMVCLDGRAHRAVDVAKVHAASLDAFTSHPFDPVARVHDDRVVFLTPRPAEVLPAVQITWPRPAGEPLPEVPLLTCYPGISADDVAAALAGREAAVLTVFGDLNVPRQLWKPIHRAAADGTLVVLASPAFTDTTGTADLDLLGVIGAGGLSAQKARLALVLALAAGADREAAIGVLRGRQRPCPHHPRSSRHD